MPANKVKIIVNPNADLGRARGVAESLRPVAQEFGAVDWVGTLYPAHAVELAAQAAEQGYELVVAAGGDGTAHEVLNGLMRFPRARRPRLGVVPAGSGNDFAHAVGMPGDPGQALRRVLSGRASTIDVVRLLDDLGRTEYAGNTVGIGFDATVTIRSRYLKFLRGFMIYLAAVIQTILLNHDAPVMKITTDREGWQQNLLLLVLCNGPREGGGFNIYPGAQVNDGVLDYACIHKVSRPMMFRLLPEVMKGTHGRFPQVRMGQFTRLEVTSDRPLYVHTDGEIWAGFNSQMREIKAEILPGELEVVV